MVNYGEKIYLKDALFNETISAFQKANKKIVELDELSILQKEEFIEFIEDLQNYEFDEIIEDMNLNLEEAFKVDQQIQYVQNYLFTQKIPQLLMEEVIQIEDDGSNKVKNLYMKKKILENLKPHSEISIIVSCDYISGKTGVLQTLKDARFKLAQ